MLKVNFHPSFVSILHVAINVKKEEQSLYSSCLTQANVAEWPEMKRTKNKVPKKSCKFDNRVITIFYFLNNQDNSRKPVEPRKRLKTGLFRVWLEKEKSRLYRGVHRAIFPPCKRL